jgi:hypothetical protein
VRLSVCEGKTLSAVNLLLLLLAIKQRQLFKYIKNV